MELLRISEIVFFLVYGISYFAPLPYFGLITAVAAIIVGVLLLI